MIDDRDGVAGPFDLVQEVRRQHDRAALGDQRQDHVAHLAHTGRIETVHRLVQDQQLRITEQTRGDTETLAHPHRVLRHPIIGATGHSDPLERRSDAVPRRPFASRGKNLQVLAARQMAVKPGLVDDRTDTRQRHIAMLRHLDSRAATSSPRRRASVPTAPGSASSCRRRSDPDSRTRTLAAPTTRRRSPQRCPRTASSTRASPPPTHSRRRCQPPHPRPWHSSHTPQRHRELQQPFNISRTRHLHSH